VAVAISKLPGTGADRIVIDRPDKANALDAATVEEIHRAVGTAIDEGVPAIAFMGAGKNFCAGFDFTGYERETSGDLLQRFVRIEGLLQRLRRSPIITIALVNGAAFGAGADLAAASTYRIGTGTTRFRFPGFQFGVALGTRHLARLVGTEKARDILLRNLVIEAEAAMRIGLLTHCAEAGTLEHAAASLLTEIASLDHEAVADVLRLTVEDTSKQDLADLVRSLSRSGLHERIAAYRARTTKA
jgi:enoyl-CoA hydratase/carnithine racemase